MDRQASKDDDNYEKDGQKEARVEARRCYGSDPGRDAGGLDLSGESQEETRQNQEILKGKTQLNGEDQGEAESRRMTLKTN